MPSRDETPSRDELAAVSTTPRLGSVSDAQPATATIARSPAASPNSRIFITPPPARAPAKSPIRVRASGPTGLDSKRPAMRATRTRSRRYRAARKFWRVFPAIAHRISETEGFLSRRTRESPDGLHVLAGRKWVEDGPTGAPGPPAQAPEGSVWNAAGSAHRGTDHRGSPVDDPRGSGRGAGRAADVAQPGDGKADPAGRLQAHVLSRPRCRQPRGALRLDGTPREHVHALVPRFEGRIRALREGALSGHRYERHPSRHRRSFSERALGRERGRQLPTQVRQLLDGRRGADSRLRQRQALQQLGRDVSQIRGHAPRPSGRAQFVDFYADLCDRRGHLRRELADTRRRVRLASVGLVHGGHRLSILDDRDQANRQSHHRPRVLSVLDGAHARYLGDLPAATRLRWMAVGQRPLLPLRSRREAGQALLS